MARLLACLTRTLLLGNAVLLSSFLSEPLVPADPQMHALLTPPTEPTLPQPKLPAPRTTPRKPVWGYFYPAWAKDARPVRGEDGIDLSLFASDPLQRLESEFKASKRQRDLVLFWASIYSEYTSQMKVIHDRTDPSLVYGYLDFTPLYAQKTHAGAALTAERIEAGVLGNLAVTLKRISRKPRARTPIPPEDQRLLGYLAAHGVNGPKALHACIGNLRTQTGQAEEFQSALLRSRNRLTQIELVFRQHGLPRALARIPFVESSFNTEARSKVGAMGLWQFVPRTARAMIHAEDRSQWVDPTLQTEAAARLLQQYHRALKTWESAITSYNSGIGRVSRALRIGRSQGRKRHLGFAGRNYFAELLAANLVEAYRDEIFSPTLIEQKRAALRGELARSSGGECWIAFAEKQDPAARFPYSNLKKVVYTILEENWDRAERWAERWIDGSSQTQFASMD